jgi:rare lipoprotein A
LPPAVLGTIGLSALTKTNYRRVGIVFWSHSKYIRHPFAHNEGLNPLKRLGLIAGAISWCFPISGSLADPYDGYFLKASYYSSGRLTASGERFDKHGFTAASRTLPFGTRLLVTNPANGRSVIVRINDRGPFIPGRHLDLAMGAADALGMIEQGTATLKVVHVSQFAESSQF